MRALAVASEIPVCTKGGKVRFVRRYLIPRLIQYVGVTILGITLDLLPAPVDARRPGRESSCRRYRPGVPIPIRKRPKKQFVL